MENDMISFLKEMMYLVHTKDIVVQLYRSYFDSLCTYVENKIQKAVV